MTNKKRVAKQRYSIEYRVEVDITDAKALEAAAVEHTKRMGFDPSDEEGLAEALEWARSGPGAALIELFDPDRSLDEIAGIEVGMSDLTTGELPRRNPYKGPGSRKYPDEKAQRDEAIERILAYSPLVEGIDYLFIDQEPDDDFVDDRTPAEKAKWEEQFTLMKGLLWHSSKRVIAQLFDDVVTLATTASVTASTMDETHVLCELPPQFARFYNLHFAQKFTAATIDVSHRLSAGWQSLGTIAEELALRLVLNDMEMMVDLWELELPEGWRGDLMDALYDDTDHEYLYDARYAGFETDSNFGPGGMAPMNFSSWFTVFNTGYYASPFANDPAPADPYEPVE